MHVLNELAILALNIAIDSPRPRTPRVPALWVLQVSARSQLETEPDQMDSGRELFPSTTTPTDDLQGLPV